MCAAKAIGGVSDAELTVMTEAELAEMRARDGATVGKHDGRHWEVPFPGFYQPIHLLARFRFEAVRRPSRRCWGYRVALHDEDALAANGSVPVHLLTDLESFTEARLNRNHRRDLRECRRRVELGRVRDSSLLYEQGYGVFKSAQLRVPFGRPMSIEDYTRQIARRVSDDRRLFIAGLVDGRLAGYMESYAVDGVLYLHEIFVATEFKSTGVGTGLYVESIQIGARSGTIREICSGIHTPERPGITAYKESLGLKVVQVPARVVWPAPIGAYIKARRPLTHYHLAGVDPAAAAAVQE